MRSQFLLFITITLAGLTAMAQESSLFRQPPTFPHQRMELSDASMIYYQLPPPRQIAKHDLVTVRVDKKAVMSAEGEMQRRKNGVYDAVLADWIAL